MDLEVFSLHRAVTDCAVVYPMADDLLFVNNILVEQEHILRDCMLSRVEAMWRRRRTSDDQSWLYSPGLIMIKIFRVHDVERGFAGGIMCFDIRFYIGLATHWCQHLRGAALPMKGVTLGLPGLHSFRGE